MLPNQSNITDVPPKTHIRCINKKKRGHVLFVVETQYEFYVWDFSNINGAVRITRVCVLQIINEIIIL